MKDININNSMKKVDNNIDENNFWNKIMTKN